MPVDISGVSSRAQTHGTRPRGQVKVDSDHDLQKHQENAHDKPESLPTSTQKHHLHEDKKDLKHPMLLLIMFIVVGNLSSSPNALVLADRLPNSSSPCFLYIYILYMGIATTQKRRAAPTRPTCLPPGPLYKTKRQPNTMRGGIQHIIRG